MRRPDPGLPPRRPQTAISKQQSLSRYAHFHLLAKVKSFRVVGRASCTGSQSEGVPHDPKALALATLAVLATPAAATPGGAQALRPAAPVEPNATVVSGCNTPKLSYGQGPLIQHVKVFDVFYNKGNTLKDMLTASTRRSPRARISTGSPSTTPRPGDRPRHLGGSVVDTGAPTTATTLTDIQMEIKRLIDAGKLPRTTRTTSTWCTSRAGVTITQGGELVVRRVLRVPRHVHARRQGRVLRRHPRSDAAACASGCGTGDDSSRTPPASSSHELIEAVTDPAVGLAQSLGAPLAGTTRRTARSATSATPRRRRSSGYTVQKEFSNQKNDCIATDPNVSTSTDFSIAGSPTSSTVPIGGRPPRQSS